MHRFIQLALGLVAAGTFFTGCGCASELTCINSSQCGSGEICSGGACLKLASDGGPIGTGGGAGGGSGSTGGGSTVVTGCNPAATDNASRDTDCDGLTDLEEYDTTYGAAMDRTDPCNADSDGDGLSDGVELGRQTSPNLQCTAFRGDQDVSSRTDPTRPDTDGDTLRDGDEDTNRDGKLDPGESNPARADTDCDGLSDPDERSGAKGCVTDPAQVDSDGDGVPDGVEQGVTAPGADPVGCSYPMAAFDQDPATVTSACGLDSDGDGISDGAEDGNKNGKVEVGELDPKLPADGMGPAQQACATANLRPITFHANGFADVQVALVPSFTEVSTLLEGTTQRGYAFYDPTAKIGGLAFSIQPAAGNAGQQEQAVRNQLQAVGTIAAPITQTFTTWDGFAGAVRSSFDQSGNADLKSRLEAMAKALLGQTVTGTLPGAAGVNGPFKVQAEVVVRAGANGTRAVVVLAVIPAASFTGARVFAVDDVAGGSALAQFSDTTGTQCEVFDSSGSAAVDFLWVVDDSCSMASSQNAVSQAGTLFGQRLATAGLDWRVGAVTTGYYSGGAASLKRDFTTDVGTMRNWFTSGQAGYFGTNGAIDERLLASVRRYLQALLPRGSPAQPNRLRTGAALHVILLGDADDQSNESAATYNSFFANYDGAASKAVVHGVLCLDTNNGCNSESPGTKAAQTVQASGGVLGDIQIANQTDPTSQQQFKNTIDAILASAIGGTGKQLARPPLSATIKVAIETNGTKGPCATSDVPRDRQNGFDFDSATRRVVFFGDCIPNGAGKKVAVSYRYWIDGSPDPLGDPCAGLCVSPKTCDQATKACVCPMNCGGACTGGLVCDQPSCTCGPGIN